jgi:hypothetical protein
LSPKAVSHLAGERDRPRFSSLSAERFQKLFTREKMIFGKI